MIIFDMMIGKLDRFGLICLAMIPDIWETSRTSVKDTGSGGFWRTSSTMEEYIFSDAYIEFRFKNRI